MAANSTRTLTGQEIVVLMGNKDDDLSDLDTPANLGLGTNGNISSWIVSCQPNISLNEQPRTTFGGGTNAVSRTQPSGTINASFSIEWAVEADVAQMINQMILENRLGQYLYPFQVVMGIAASDNTYYRCLGHLQGLPLNIGAESLVTGSSTLMVDKDFSMGQTTGMLN